MRWGSTGNGSFGVGATAYTLASRNENASYYYYQEPSAPLVAFGVPPSHGQPRGVVNAKKLPDKRQGRRIIGSNARFTKVNRKLKVPKLVVAEDAPDSPEVASSEPESIGHAPLIMCAGKSFYGTTNDSSGSEDRDNNGINQRGDDETTRQNDRPAPFRAIAAVKTKRMMVQSSPSRHRTDEELEQIIRDLRDQVFQNQQKQDYGQRQTLNPTVNNENSAEAGKHYRKHLKNPVEKMETAAFVPVASSVDSKPMTNSGLLLQRPLSSCQLNQLVAESTIQIVVPAVINEAPPATVRTGTRTSSNNSNCQVSSLDFGSLRSRPRRPNSSSGYRPGEKQSVRSNLSSAPKRIRRQKGSSKAREHDYYDNSSDCGEGYLYLVDVDDSVDVESLALSPVGPWVVDDFSADGSTTETPRSPSVSTCYSVSSLGSEDLDFGGGGGELSNSELAAMSPRSRLLYFSTCTYNSETARSMTSQLPQGLRRSATCSSGLIATSLESRATKPKRSLSANTSTRGKTRPSSSSTAVSNQKARGQVRKRPQSEGTASSRSCHSDTAIPLAR